MRPLLPVLSLLLLTAIPARPAPATPAHARLPLRAVMPHLQPGMPLADAQALLGAPDHTSRWQDAGDQTDWDYLTSDGRVDLTVSRGEGKVRQVKAYCSLAVARRLVRVGVTVSQAQGALAARKVTRDGQLQYFRRDHPERDANYLVQAYDGELNVWVNMHTHHIRRITESPGAW